MPAVADAGTRGARRAALRASGTSTSPQVLDVVELSSGRLGLVVEHVDGLSLAQIRAARAPLTDGEAATVAIPVAGALAALHDAGLAHGAVERVDGRGAARRPAGADRPARCSAGAGDTEADVRRLVATVLAPDAGRGRAPGLRRADGRRCGRPSPELLTRARARRGARGRRVLRATADPEPVRLPDAGCAGVVGAGRRARGATHAVPRTRRRAARRTTASPAAWSCLASVAVLAVVRWRSVGGSWRAPSPQRGRRRTDRDDPVAAAVELSTAAGRGRSGDADPAALGAVEVPDGPAHTADVAARSPTCGRRADGLDGRRAGRVAGRGRRAAAARRRTSPVRDVRARPGPADGGAAAGGRATVVLGLRWTDDGWRVWDVVGAADVSRAATHRPRGGRSACTGTKPLASSTGGPRGSSRAPRTRSRRAPRAARTPAPGRPRAGGTHGRGAATTSALRAGCGHEVHGAVDRRR